MTHLSGGTNHHVHISARYRESAGAPESLFCKFLPCDPTKKELIANTNMGLREARFYKEVAPLIELRMPEIYYAECDQHDGAFVVLMENIETSGCSVSDGTQTVSVDSAARALEELANMHRQFESPQAKQKTLPWLTEKLYANAGGSNYGPNMLQYGLDNHRDKLSPAFASVAEIYIEQHPALHALWTQGPKTLIHGDTHIGNVFDDQGHTGFLDWGIISIGTPMRDLSYFLIMCMSTEDRRNHQEDLIKHYLDVRNAGQGVNITFDEAWRAHQLHAAYGVPASCHVVTFPESASDRRKIFADAFLRRVQAALEDLDVVKVVKGVL